MNLRRWSVLCLLALIVTPRSTSAAPSATIIRKTERALVHQLRCKEKPEVAKAINAMLKNGLIRYRKGYDGEYLFTPKVPMKFLGLRITHITAFDEHRAFRRAPRTKIMGGIPFHSIQIDVAARVSQLKNRAKRAGMLDAWLTKDHPGLEIDDEPSYMAPKTRLPIAKIRCVAW